MWNVCISVISLRQVERKSEREKEKHKEEMTRLEEYYKQHIVKLEGNVKTLESDRNLLMVI